MTDQEYIELFDKLYNNPDEVTMDNIEKTMRLLDILTVNCMKLATAAGPWDGENFETSLVDCNDLLEMYTLIHDAIKALRNGIQKDKRMLYVFREMVHRYLEENDVKVDGIEEGD